MGRMLYFDCAAGAAGDMVLGALIDAGAPIDLLRSALDGLLLPGWRIEAERVTRAGVAACKFRLREPEGAGSGAGGHLSAHHHRTVTEVCALVRASALSQSAKARTCDLFTRLAETEAAIHREPVADVHLHEVGALDSIVDIAGSVVALEWFHPDHVQASPLNVGAGTVQTAHGRLPVPAPATAALLAGVPVYSSGIEGELVTPTGALLISSYAEAFGPLPLMKIDRIGYGAGDRDPGAMPNVVRVMTGETSAAAAADRVLVMECEIDDMNPQLCGPLAERLYAAGALEVYFTAVQMKKGRPGVLLTILGRSADRDALAAVVFRESTTIGLRYQEVDRLCLDREVRTVQTPLGAVRFKLARLGGDIVNAAPEFDDCARLAREHGLAVKEVQAIANMAFRD